MTADIELLPLPAEDYVDDEGLWEKRHGPYSHEQMDDYARANVDHATAAKDAEIEALRREVAEARDGWHMANGTADLAMKHRDMAEARAERLAEALRELVVDMERAQANMRNAAKTDPRWEGCAEAIQPRVAAAEAALRDHDQEVGNG